MYGRRTISRRVSAMRFAYAPYEIARDSATRAGTLERDRQPCEPSDGARMQPLDLIFDDLVVRNAREKELQSHTCLHLGQQRAEAGMRSVSEGEVGIRSAIED